MKLTEAQLDAWKDGVLLSGAAGPWPARCTELIAECYRLRALVEKAYTEGRQDQDDTSRRPEKPGEQEANAALIVRAVNSHADLVAALGRVLSHYTSRPHCGHYDFPCRCKDDDIASARAFASAARAK